MNALLIGIVVAAACVVAGVVAGVVIELLTRAWLARRGPYFICAPFARLRLELDRDALPALDPIAEWDVNVDGERGAAPPKDWRRSLRVLVTGGSAAECYFLDQKRTWPEVIARQLSNADDLRRLDVDRVHVGNVARSLVACEEIDLMLARTLPRYERLDAVVLMVGASDVVHWLEKETPPVIAEHSIPPSQVFAWHPEGPFGWSPRTLAVRRVASYWNKRLRRPIERRDRAGKRLGEARSMRQRAQIVLSSTPDPAPMLDRFDTYLRRLIERAKARGARVILARQPWLEGDLTPEQRNLLWNFGAGRPQAREVTTYYAHETVWKLLALVDRRAEAIANELGIEQVDLNAVVPRDFEHYYDELHHTPKGCEVVGRAIARQIVAGAR